MASLDIIITYPDEKQDELLAALRDYYGKKEDGTDYTALELRGMFHSFCRQKLRTIYRKYKSKQNPVEEL